MIKHIKVVVFVFISVFLVFFTAFYLGRTVYLEIKEKTNNQEGIMLGGDRDEHGCIGSAGYSWCEKKNKCLRIWEEACDGSITDKNTLPVNGAKQCGLENCHGLEIKCGPNPVDMCTAMYALGDKCRQYVKCGIVNGACGQIEDSKFDLCKKCVQNCMNKYATDSSMRIFECENDCK